MSRRFRPVRPPRDLPQGHLEMRCVECGLPGRFVWRRGVVIHALSPDCVVPAPVVVDKQEAEAAA